MSHPEEDAVTPWLLEPALEVGCGSNPTPGVAVTVDHTPGGQLGSAGCEDGQVSRAQVSARMTQLPFRPGAFRTLVARHVLEHDEDTLEVLREWQRVADRLVIVCPDQASYPGNTVSLDPTHRAAFTGLQLARLAEHLGLTVRLVQPAVPNWSFLLVAER